MGVADDSNEVYIGTDEGVLKVNTAKRQAFPADRWNYDKFKITKGTAWQPNPAEGDREVRSNVVTWIPNATTCAR